MYNFNYYFHLFLRLVFSIIFISFGKSSKLIGLTSLFFLTSFKLYFVSLNSCSIVEALSLTVDVAVSSYRNISSKICRISNSSLCSPSIVLPLKTFSKLLFELFFTSVDLIIKLFLKLTIKGLKKKK